MRLFRFIKNLPQKHLLALSILSAVFYNSWILGYFLNKSQINNAYFSVLQIPGRPYYLLYIILDIICGLLIILIGLYLLKTIKPEKKTIIYYLGFGLFIILDAIYPISNQCSTTISKCGYSLSQIFSYHDVLGIIMFTLIFLILKNISKIARRHHNVLYRNIIKYNFYLYILSLISLVASVPFDLFTDITQAVVIILTSATISITPLVIILDKKMNLN